MFDFLSDNVAFNIIVQFIGFVGMFLCIISFQSKSYQKIIWIRVASEFVFAVQYFLLGAYTGMATNLTSCVTNTIYRERIKRGKKVLGFQIAFGILFAVIGILSWHGPLSLLVIAAKILSTVANGNPNPKTIRIFNLIINPLWLIYDIFVFSLAGILSDSFTIISLIIAMISKALQTFSNFHFLARKYIPTINNIDIIIKIKCFVSNNEFIDFSY